MKISYICTTKIIFISRDHALTLVFKNRLSAAWQLFRLAQSFLQTQEYLSNIDCVMTNDKRDQDSLKSLQLISVPYILVVLELVMMKFVFFFFEMVLSDLCKSKSCDIFLRYVDV